MFKMQKIPDIAGNVFFKLLSLFYLFFIFFIVLHFSFNFILFSEECYGISE